MQYCFILSGNYPFFFFLMKEPIAVSLIALNYTSHQYQNGLENLFLHIVVYAYFV